MNVVSKQKQIFCLISLITLSSNYHFMQYFHVTRLCCFIPIPRVVFGKTFICFLRSIGRGALQLSKIGFLSLGPSLNGTELFLLMIFLSSD